MVEIAPAVYTQIDELVKAGKYSTIEGFTEIALRNQIKLEKLQSEKISNTISEKTAIIDSDEHRLQYRQDPITVEPLSVTVENRNEPLFGLINRFAPAKFALRLLSSRLVESGKEWINYHRFIEDVTGAATWARLRIEKHEKRMPPVRGQSLKIGFPFKDTHSQQRFVDFYVGRFRSDNRVQGLLGDLGLAAFRRNADGTVSIGITAAGMTWTKLHSPLVDDLLLGQSPIHSPLSDDETQFLVSQISTTRPGEYQFLEFLFKAVQDGSDSPQKLSPLISSYFGARKYTAVQQNTLQTGGMARLVEMRYIVIEKDGIYTKYVPQKAFGSANSAEIEADGEVSTIEDHEIEGEMT